MPTMQTLVANPLNSCQRLNSSMTSPPASIRHGTATAIACCCMSRPCRATQPRSHCVPADGIWTAYKRDFGTSRQPIQLEITMVSGLDKRAAVPMQTWAAAPHRPLSEAKLTS